MASLSGGNSVRLGMLYTQRERMRDETIARLRAIARARGASLVGLQQPDHAGLGGSDQTAYSHSLPMLLLPNSVGAAPTHILLATDFSESSLSAGRAALAFAPGAHVHLVHVCPSRWCCTPGEPDDQGTAQLDGIYAALFAAFEATLQAPAARFTHAVLHGDPADTLLSHAMHRGVDLIVLGVHGHASVQDKALGLVAERVLREAPCGVLVAGVESRMEPRMERGLSKPSGKRLVV